MRFSWLTPRRERSWRKGDAAADDAPHPCDSRRFRARPRSAGSPRSVIATIAGEGGWPLTAGPQSPALRAVGPPTAGPQSPALRAVGPPTAGPQSPALRAVGPPTAGPQ